LILSDGEIKQALREGKIVIDPEPAETDYTTSALDLHLGDQLFELVTPEELAAQEPRGVRRPIDVDVSAIAIRALTQQYARELAQRLGVDESQVSRDERNEYYGITVERAQRILDALGAQVVTRVVETSDRHERVPA
jgi:Helix-turn-helix